MKIDVEKLKSDSKNALVQLTYMTVILEEYKDALESLKKADPDFYKHFIAEKDEKELARYQSALQELTGMESLLPRLYGQMNLIDDYKYVMGLKDCLYGSVPEMVRLFGYMDRSKSGKIERKFMAQIGLKGENLGEVNARYQKDRNKLSNRAVEKETFIKDTEPQKPKKAIPGSTAKYNGITGNNVNRVKCIGIGDVITFGNYPQEKDGTVKPIEWRVLAREGEKALLISRYALDCKRYNESFADTTWKSCTLRKWLNSDFISKAFSEDEKYTICEGTVTADRNPKYSTNPGSDTTDKVFLLSIPEVEKYFKNNEDRKCVPTSYAVKQGTYASNSYEVDGKPTCWWWLRSPGSSSHSAAYVNADGSVYAFGNDVSFGRNGVRPALWINL